MLQNITMTKNQPTEKTTLKVQTQADGYYDEADLNLDDEELNLDFLDE